MFQLICHIAHIAATCTSLGGLFYARLVLWPTLPTLPESERDAFLRRMVKRYSSIKWIGMAVITATGIAQMIDIWPEVTDRTSYLLAFGVKMAGVLGLFSITALLALPLVREGLPAWIVRMQDRRAFWSGLNIVCGLIVLTGAALMRAARMG